MATAKGRNADGIQALRGPFVQCAFLCDSAIESKDGTFTFVRAIDYFKLEGKAQVYESPEVDISDANLPTLLSFTMVFVIKGFKRSGNHLVTVQPYGPDGNPAAGIAEIEITVSEPMFGANVVVPTNLVVGNSGLYSLRFAFEKRELARILFLVEDNRIRERIDFGSESDSRATVYGERQPQ